MVKEKEIVAVLDNIRSAYNVGSILRTADACGIKKVYLCGITPSPPHPKIAKTALGAENYLEIKKHGQTWQILEQLKKEGYFLMALEQTKNSRNIFNCSLPKNKKIALIVGPEVKGLSKRILKRTDAQVEIPMWGRKESLNVSVAFGIAAYLLKERLKKK